MEIRGILRIRIWLSIAFEMTVHCFPSVCEGVYDTHLDIKFATLEHVVYSEGQLTRGHWSLSLTHVVLLGDPGQAVLGHFLTCALEMPCLCLMRHSLF